MGEDFTLPQTSVTFISGTPTGDTQPVFVDVIDDDDVEGMEFLLLTGIVAPPASFLGDSTINVTIMDDDGKCFIVLLKDGVIFLNSLEQVSA